MKNCFLSLLLLFSLFTSAQGNRHHAIDVFIFRADYQNALIEVEKQLDASPNDPALIAIKGRIVRAMGDEEQAMDLYNRALAKDAACERCLAEYVLYFINKFELTKADSVAKLISNPQLAYTEYVLGTLDLKRNSISAIIHLNRCVALDPMMAEYLGARGFYRLVNGMPLSAKSDVDSGMAIDTSNLYCKFTMAQLLASSGDFMGAKIHCEGILKADSSGAALRLYSGVLHQLGRYEEADGAMRAAIEENPNNAMLYYEWAQQYFEREDMDGVCEQYNAVLPLLSGNEHAEERAYIQEKHEELCNPNKSSYYYQRGVAAYNLGDFESAIDIYNSGLSKFPNSPLMLSFKANALIQLKSYSAAIPIYHKSLSLRGAIVQEAENNSKEYANEQGNTTVLYTFVSDIQMSLMECYQSTGQPELALTYADSGVALMESLLGSPGIIPYLSSAFVMRAELHLVQGRTEMAEADLKRATELYPSSTAAPVTRVKLILGSYQLDDFHLYNSFAVYKFDELDKLPSFSYDDLREAYSEEDLQAALNECNNVLEVTQSASAYLYRAHIKKILQDPSYKMDLQAANNLGQVLAYPLLGEE